IIASRGFSCFNPFSAADPTSFSIIVAIIWNCPRTAPVGRSLVLIAGAPSLLFVLVFTFNRLVVPERSELSIRPGDDFLALIQTALDLDVVFASDSRLDRGEDGFVVLNDEYAFDRLLVFRIRTRTRTRIRARALPRGGGRSRA